jgi:hypothetical protein
LCAFAIWKLLENATCDQSIWEERRRWQGVARDDVASSVRQSWHLTVRGRPTSVGERVGLSGTTKCNDTLLEVWLWKGGAVKRRSRRWGFGRRQRAAQ